VADDYAGRVKVGKVNVDDHPDLAGRYAVRSIPTVIVFRDGKEAERIVGASQKARYAQAVLSRI
jgi:thioredoxin 1